MSKFGYWLDKVGVGGILLGPAESATRLMLSGNYTGPDQLSEGMGIMTSGLACWNMAKYEQEKDVKRSPLVHAGRMLEVAGPAITEGLLLSGKADNIFRTFGPAALGVTGGAFCEYVLGPIHEKLSKKYSGVQ